MKAQAFLCRKYLHSQKGNTYVPEKEELCTDFIHILSIAFKCQKWYNYIDLENM